MLCAVIHKHSAHILHKSAEKYVYDKHNKHDATLNKAIPQAFKRVICYCRDFADKVGKSIRCKDEKQNCKTDTKEKRKCKHQIHWVDFVFFCDLLFNFAWLGKVTIDFCRAHQNAHTFKKLCDEIDNPPHKGQTEKYVALLGTFHPFALNGNFSCFGADCCCNNSFALHHDALHNGLTANGCALHCTTSLFFDLILFHFCHKIPKKSKIQSPVGDCISSKLVEIVSLLELINTATGVNQFLFASEVRMAL